MFPLEKRTWIPIAQGWSVPNLVEVDSLVLGKVFITSDKTSVYFHYFADIVSSLGEISSE